MDCSFAVVVFNSSRISWLTYDRSSLSLKRVCRSSQLLKHIHNSIWCWCLMKDKWANDLGKVELWDKRTVMGSVLSQTCIWDRMKLQESWFLLLGIKLNLLPQENKNFSKKHLYLLDTDPRHTANTILFTHNLFNSTIKEGTVVSSCYT